MKMEIGTQAGEIAVAATKASPPVAVSGMAAAGIPLSDMVLVLTAIYTALQIALLIRKFLKERRAERGA